MEDDGIRGVAGGWTIIVIVTIVAIGIVIAMDEWPCQLKKKKSGDAGSERHGCLLCCSMPFQCI